MGVGGTCGTSSLLPTPFCLGSVQPGSGKGAWVVPPGPCTDPGLSWSCFQLFHSLSSDSPQSFSSWSKGPSWSLSHPLVSLFLRDGVQGLSEVPPDGLAVSAVIRGKSFTLSES